MRNPSSSSSSPATTAEGNKNKKSSRGTSTTPTPCCSKVGLKRGPWTPEEDKVLGDYIRKEGEGRWRTLPKRAGLLRCGKSCRLRWMNYLRPCVKRGQIAPDEEDLILRLHRLLGNRWSLIAGRIPGRTDNEIKNYWNTHLSKKLIIQGIDPRTHKPLNPPIPSSSTTPPSNYKPVSSKPNNNNNPLPPIITNHPTPSTHHPIRDAIPNPDHLIIVNQENAYLDPKSTTDDHLDQYQEAQVAGNIVTDNGYHAAYDNLNPTAATDSDFSAMDLIRSNNLLTTNNEDDDDINYCSDDVFSSFLNSLINEDAFATQQHLQPEPPNGHSIAPHSDHDPLISINTASASPAYGFGVGWESPLMSATVIQNDPKRLDDHNE